jgi:hypothetical protein
MPRLAAVHSSRQFQAADAPAGAVRKNAADSKATDAAETNEMA